MLASTTMHLMSEEWTKALPSSNPGAKLQSMRSSES